MLAIIIKVKTKVFTFSWRSLFQQNTKTNTLTHFLDSGLHSILPSNMSSHRSCLFYHNNKKNSILLLHYKLHLFWGCAWHHNTNGQDFCCGGATFLLSDCSSLILSLSSPEALNSLADISSVLMLSYLTAGLLLSYFIFTGHGCYIFSL